MKAKKIIIIVVLLVAVGFSAILLSKSENNADTSTSQKQRAAKVEVKHNSFDPSTLAVKKGTKVTWINSEDDLEHKVASNPHPSHSDVSDLVSGQLGEGDSYSYTFNKTGTFRYHDDLNPTVNGTIIVN